MKTITTLLAFLMTITFTYALKHQNLKTTEHLNCVNDLDEEEAVVQIALLLDTSNSMDGLINQAKSQLWDIVNEFSTAKCGNKNPKLQIAIYQYGNDRLSSKNGYIQQVLNFTSDLDEISEKLFSLSTNGGEEYCGTVIKTSLEQLEWKKTKKQLKLIFIAGNEPFDQGKYSYENAAENAKKKDVIVNTIFCGDYEQGISSYWKDGAISTGGEYMALEHNKQIVYVKTPYDDLILKLNKQLNRTYVSYGAFGKAKIASQQTQDSNAMEFEATVAVKRAVSKSSSFYNNKKWDLVDASNESDFEISKISQDDLPEELKDKTKNEIKDYIEAKKLKRATIQKEIQELNKKRETYLSKNKTNEESEGLETVMLRAIKKQASAKNYSW